MTEGATTSSIDGALVPFYTLTVTRAGSGAGAVTSSPAGINCGAACASQYDFSTIVTLTPTSAAGSQFAGWTGACSGTGPCQVNVQASVAVGATFIKSPPPTVHCVVPKLKGTTPSKAQTLLAAAHCTLGLVTKPPHSKGKKLVVKSQSPSPGTTHASGESVSVKLGPKPHHKKH